MHTAALIFNPSAGTAERFHRHRAQLLRTLAEDGISAELLATSAVPGSTALLAREAAKRCDLVIACGGDGTVHQVLQGVANTDAALGVLPFGTANALVRNLSPGRGVIGDPVRMLRRLLAGHTALLPLGRAQTSDQTRWFALLAGAGPDGALIHRMNGSLKRRLGRHAYYTESLRLFVSQRFSRFAVEYRVAGETVWHHTEAAAMLASRVSDLGGMFGGLTRNARLDHPHLRVQLMASPALVSLPAWFAFGHTRLEHRNPWLKAVNVNEIHCRALSSAEVLCQLDGEPAGPLPLRLSIVAQALRLRMPAAEP